MTVYLDQIKTGITQIEHELLRETRVLGNSREEELIIRKK